MHFEVHWQGLNRDAEDAHARWECVRRLVDIDTNAFPPFSG